MRNPPNIIDPTFDTLVEVGAFLSALLQTLKINDRITPERWNEAVEMAKAIGAETLEGAK